MSYNGSVGEAFYQPEAYWSTDDVNALYSRYKDFNQYIGLFLAAVIRLEKYKFSYGRKWTLENMKLTEICLPIQSDKDGNVIIDNTYKWSDKGYIPDWQFMEEYIKSLHHKPLTTKNKSGKAPDLNVEKWREFKVGDLYSILIAKSADFGNLDEGKTPFIGRTDLNNGLQGFVNPVSITDGHCISISMVGTNVALYQEYSFQASQNIAVLYNKGMTKFNALFVSSLINFEMCLKYSYGRTVGKTNIEEMIIKLPITPNGDPDWQFMENYIKSLPYGDRLEG